MVAGNARSARLYGAESELVAELAHFGSVRCVAFRPGGERLATGSDDMGVRIWTRDGTCVALLKGHLHAVDGVAWSGDGALLASASRDGVVRAWSVTNDGATERWSVAQLASRPSAVAWLGDELLIGTEESVELRGSSGPPRAPVATGFVRRVRVSVDQRFIAAEHHVWRQNVRHDSVTIWNAVLEQLWSGDAATCAFGSDGSIAIAEGEGLVVRALPGGEQRWLARPHDGEIFAIAARDDGGWLTGGNDTLACVVSDVGRVVGVVRHDHAVHFCSSSGEHVLTATGTGSTTRWSASEVQPAPPPRTKREPIARFALEPGGTSAQYSADGSQFAVSAGELVELRRARDGHVTRRLECGEPAWAVAWKGELVSVLLQSEEARRFWSAGSGAFVVDLADAHYFATFAHSVAIVGDEPLRVYRIGGSPPSFELIASHDADPHATAVSASARLVFIAANDGGRLLDVSTGRSRSLTNPGSHRAAFSPDETRLVVARSREAAGDSTTLWYLDALDTPPVSFATGSVSQILWSPSGERLALATREQRVVLLRGDGTHIVTRGERGRGAINPVFSSDGQILATGGRDGPAALWRADDGEHIADLGGLATSHIKVQPVAGDTRWLTHASVMPAGDLTLKLWARDGEPIATLPGHSGKGWWQVNVSPCSNWIVSIVWGDAGPRVWNARDGSLWGLLEGHGPNVRVGVFSPTDPDGHVRLITGDDDGNLAIWKIDD